MTTHSSVTSWRILGGQQSVESRRVGHNQHFSLSMLLVCGCESWTIKIAEHRRIDAFELWCWRRLLRVPWTARRSNQSILKESSSGCSLVTRLCPTLRDPMACGTPGSSVHGILQARTLEWVVIPFSKGSSRPRDQTHVSSIAGKFFTL